MSRIVSHFLSAPKTNWFFPLSPETKCECECWCLRVCVCLSVCVCHQCHRELDSIEFSDWKWKLCRSCIMFCLLVCTWTQTEGESVCVRDWWWWCARILYECESFLAQSKLFLYQNLCVVCRAEAFFSLALCSIGEKNIWIETVRHFVSILLCTKEKKKKSQRREIGDVCIS